MESSSHLWHYTSFENMKKILKEGLKLSAGDGDRYDYLGKGNMKFMRVCFTNMGIEDNEIHISKFDNCFIGFNNKWVNDNHICPVIYCRNEGGLTRVLKDVMEQVNPITAQKLCQYCKQYSDLASDGYNGPYKGDKQKLRRYDEHEWRYVPEGYSQEFLTFDPKDVFAIYVSSESQKVLLEKEFPDYKEKIKVFIDYSEF